ncbi:MAG TPA: HlyD family secretion protein, partial [Acidocella sp.]|nr:HlyD family secretion protein [Acidocella sp.]
HTQVVAPFDGMVGNKTVAVGDYLQPGAQVMAVVPLDQVYVIANYKETQITNIRPGQKVRLSVDGFPDLKVTGHVDSIYPSSGQAFALLPPDNATGNFTKIVQRVPVKILLDLTPELVGKLRPGMSVEPEIDTRT